MSKVVSEQHQKFLDLFFEYRGNATKAAEAAGFAPNYGYVLVRTLRKEIIEVAEGILALHAPRAAITLVEGVEEGVVAPTNPLKISCAKEILDRVGVVKKEQIQVDLNDKAGIFILPSKNSD